MAELKRTGIRTAGRTERAIPVSLAQQGALLPERVLRTPAGNRVVALSVAGEIDIARLDAAAVAVVDAHEILRTVYPDDRRTPYQKVLAAPTTLVTDAAVDTGFDLATELPVRVRWEAESKVLTIVVHPVAADDRSLDVFADALFAAYDGTAPTAASQFKETATRELATLAHDDPELAYWTDRLAGAPDRVAPVGDASRATSELELGSVDIAPLAVAAAAVAGKAAGLSDPVLVGLVEPGPAGVIGPYANQLAVVPGADAAASIDAARAHSEPRIERITHVVRGAAALTSGALFQVLVDVRPGTLEIGFSAGTAREIERRTSRPHGVDVAVTVTPTTLTVDGVGAAEFAAAIGTLIADPAATADISMSELFVAPSFEFTENGLGGEPQTDGERVLVDAIRRVLDLDEDDPVGREDTFFALGGDSIAALRLATDLGNQGYAIEVQNVFVTPQLCQLALSLNAATAAAAPVKAAPMSASGLDASALAALGNRFGGS